MLAAMNRNGRQTPVQVNLDIRMTRFHLPPVNSALAIGKRAPIGANAMSKALDEMLPGAFRKVDVEHDLIEALLIRVSHLRRVPEDKLLDVLLRNAEGFMADTEMLHLDVGLEVCVKASLEV
jgi:hypothetical protein